MESRAAGSRFSLSFQLSKDLLIFLKQSIGQLCRSDICRVPSSSAGCHCCFQPSHKRLRDAAAKYLRDCAPVCVLMAPTYRVAATVFLESRRRRYFALGVELLKEKPRPIAFRTGPLTA
jgi:hypothetical protein